MTIKAPTSKAPAAKRVTNKVSTSKPATRKAPAAKSNRQLNLSGEQVVEIFRLLKGATSAELKVSVPVGDRRAAIAKLKFDPVEAEPRQVYFFDTPDLALNRAGLVVRARRIRGGRGDTVVKLRPIEPDAVDPDLLHSESFKIEVDAMPGGFVCSASFKGVCDSQEVLDVAEGSMPLSKLLTKGQRAFYEAYAPADLALDSLVPLGPTFLLRVKYQPKKAFDREITVELWLYPDGSRIFEISTKAEPDEAFQVAAEFKTFLLARGIRLEQGQETKTNSALEYFSKKLRSAKRR